MRKVTHKTVSAFTNNKGAINVGNTSVEYFALLHFNGMDFYDARALKLHGNIIAVFNSAHGLYITAAGWKSNTTKERLNAIPGVSIQQKCGVWYLNGKEWDGKPIKVVTNS